jgi:hypothetical protein
LSSTVTFLGITTLAGTPQRNTCIAMVIASGNFAGTPAVTITVVMAIFLTLSDLVMVLRKI